MNNIPDILQRAILPMAPPTRLTADKLKGPTQVRLLGSEARQAVNDEPEPAEPFSEEWRQQADKGVQQVKDDISRGCDERAMRRETELYWRGRNIEDYIRGGQ